MRQSIAFILIASLLLVSSLPLVAAANGCPLVATAHATALDATGSNGAVMQMKQDGMPAPCSLECACGCHRNVDSLPQLLAPHAIGDGAARSQAAHEAPAIDVAMALQPRSQRVLLPPPRTLR